jgi:hypothetical protein
MIENEIKKSANIILCCAPGIGSQSHLSTHLGSVGLTYIPEDITPNEPEFRLAQKHDPEGRRSICKLLVSPLAN